MPVGTIVTDPLQLLPIMCPLVVRVKSVAWLILLVTFEVGCSEKGSVHDRKACRL